MHENSNAFEDVYLAEPMYGFDLEYDVPYFDEEDGEECEGCPWEIPDMDIPF